MLYSSNDIDDDGPAVLQNLHFVQRDILGA